MSTVDGHGNEAEPSPRDDLLAADDALDGDDEADAGALQWTRAFVAERKGPLGEVMLDDVLAAARDATVDEESVRRALHTMGVRARRSGRLRRRAATEDVAASRPERQSNRAPGGKVRIVAVDLNTDGHGQVDTHQPMSIVVQIRCDEPGRLHARVLLRGGQRGELEAIAHGRDVTHPGLYAFSCDIPADVLGGLKHAVDVEAWLTTSSETYATMHACAQRFKSRERSGHGPFVHIDASWSEAQG